MFVKTSCANESQGRNYFKKIINKKIQFLLAQFANKNQALLYQQ